MQLPFVVSRLQHWRGRFARRATGSLPSCAPCTTRLMKMANAERTFRRRLDSSAPMRRPRLAESDRPCRQSFERSTGCRARHDHGGIANCDRWQDHRGITASGQTSSLRANFGVAVLAAFIHVDGASCLPTRKSAAYGQCPDGAAPRPRRRRPSSTPGVTGNHSAAASKLPDFNSRRQPHDAAYGQAVNCCQPRVVDNVSGPCHSRASGRTSLHQGPTRPRPERADTAMRSTVIAVAIRLAISASLAVSGVVHAYLYVNGYLDISTIGPAFLGQAIVFCVLALLILAGDRIGCGGSRAYFPPAHWSRSRCRAPSGSSDSPNGDGTHHRRRRSA